MAKHKLNHLDYAEEAEAAQRAGAWPQAAALWRRAADDCPGDVVGKYLGAAAECENHAAIDSCLEKIGSRILGIPTLKTRHSDQADFHDLAVWNIKRAMMAAYEAGRDSAKNSM